MPHSLRTSLFDCIEATAVQHPMLGPALMILPIYHIACFPLAAHRPDGVNCAHHAAHAFTSLPRSLFAGSVSSLPMVDPSRPCPAADHVLGVHVLRMAWWNMTLSLTRAWLCRFLLPMHASRFPILPLHHPQWSYATLLRQHHLCGLHTLVVPFAAQPRRVLSSGDSLPPAARAFGSDKAQSLMRLLAICCAL